MKLFSPIWSHANEKEKKIVKIQKCKILKDKKKKKKIGLGEKVPFLQIGINLLDGF